MVCNKCGKIYGGKHCVFCGSAANKRAANVLSEQIETTAVCLGCGSIIDRNATRCRKCGLPKGMTARQYKYAGYNENKFLPFSIVSTLLLAVVWVISTSMACLIMFLSFTFSLLGYFSCVNGGSGKRGSVICLIVSSAIIYLYLF